MDEQDEEDAVNLLDLYRAMRDNKGLIKRIMAVSLVLGLLVTLVSPTEFETEAELMPELQESGSQASELLQQYGGALGLGALQGSGGGDEEGLIPPEVYPRIVQSLTFRYDLLNRQVRFTEPDTTITLFEYFDRYYSLSVAEWLARNTVGVPGRIARALSDAEMPEEVRRQLEEEGLRHLTYEEYKALQKLEGRVTASLNPETGVLVVTAEMPDAVAAARVCDIAIDMLTDYLKEYRTQKARNDLEFQTEQVEQARARFDSTQQALAEFQDHNVNLQSQTARAKVQKLRAEFDLAYDLYTTASQQQAEARRKLQEQTPVFKVIEEASVPVETSKPRRVLTLVAFLAAGMAVSYIFVSVRRIWEEIRAKL